MTISAIFREMKIKLYALTLASRCHQCRHWRLKACNFPRRHSCSCKDRFLKAGSSSARGHRTTVPTTLQPAPVYIPHTPWLKQTPESSKRSTNINMGEKRLLLLLLHHHYTFPSSPSHSPVHLFTTCTDYPDFFQPSFFSLSPRRNMKGRVLWMHTQFYGDVITQV